MVNNLKYIPATKCLYIGISQNKSENAMKMLVMSQKYIWLLGIEILLANSGFLIKINASAKNIKMIKFGAQIKKYKKNEATLLSLFAKRYAKIKRIAERTINII